MKSQFTINELEKPHGRCNWIVCGFINGKRRRAFKKTKGEAERLARLWNQELAQEGHRLADIPNELRAEAITQQERLDRALAAHPGAIGVFTLTRAVDELLARFDLRTKSILVSEAWKQFQAHLEEKVQSGVSRPYTQDSYKRIERFVAEFAGEQLCDLTTGRIRQWLKDVRQQDGTAYSLTSKENLRVHLSSFFSFCVEHEWVQTHPMIKKIKALKIKEEKQPEILVAEQAARLLEVADAEILPAIAIGLFAGLRPEEVRRLDWADVLWYKNEIFVKAIKSKTAKQRNVPMEANLIEWLAPYRTATGPIWNRSKSNLEKRITAAGVAAGIASWPKDGLRHSYGSHHYAAYDNAPLTAARMGHETTEMLFDHYCNQRCKDEGLAYFQIRPVAVQELLAAA